MKLIDLCPWKSRPKGKVQHFGNGTYSHSFWELVRWERHPSGHFPSSLSLPASVRLVCLFQAGTLWPTPEPWPRGGGKESREREEHREARGKEERGLWERKEARERQGEGGLSCTLSCVCMRERERRRRPTYVIALYHWGSDTLCVCVYVWELRAWVYVPLWSVCVSCSVFRSWIWHIYGVLCYFHLGPLTSLIVVLTDTLSLSGKCCWKNLRLRCIHIFSLKARPVAYYYL